MMMTARHQGSFDDRPHEDKNEDRFPLTGGAAGQLKEGRQCVVGLRCRGVPSRAGGVPSAPTALGCPDRQALYCLVDPFFAASSAALFSSTRVPARMLYKP